MEYSFLFFPKLPWRPSNLLNELGLRVKTACYARIITLACIIAALPRHNYRADNVTGVGNNYVQLMKLG